MLRTSRGDKKLSSIELRVVHLTRQECIYSFNFQLAPFRNDFPSWPRTGEERNANFAKVEVRHIA